MIKNIESKKNKTDDPEYFKNYYHAHKEKILEKLKKKIKCSCGKKISYANLAKHKKSYNHMLIMTIKRKLSKKNI